MSWRNISLGLVFLFVAGILVFAALVQAPGVDEQTLAERCALSTPSWQGYSEDIKAQIGAAPVAEWEGTIQAVSVAEGLLRLTIQLEAPWADRPFQLPILFRDPYGEVHLSREAEREGAQRVYLFDLSGVGSLTWLEVLTPDGRRRITLGPEQTWTEG